MSLDIYEAKWYKKATAAFRKVWVDMVKRAESFEAYVAGVAAVTGLPEDVVRASLPAVNWKEFQANAEKYVDIALKKIEKAYSTHKWANKYKAAFSTRAA